MRTDTLTFESIRISPENNEFSIVLSHDGKPFVRTLQTNIPITIPREQFENVVFHIGLFCLLDLDQMLMPKKVVINAGRLNDEQVRFYMQARHLYARQHFFERRAPMSMLTSDIETRGKVFRPYEGTLDRQKIMMAFGGGKESILGKVLMRKLGVEPLWFVRTRKSFKKTLESIADSAKLGEYVSLGEDVELYKNSYIDTSYCSRTNTGISIYMLAMSLFAMQKGVGNICLGNEKSATDPYCMWDGHIVNHQFDKAPEYRRMMDSYLKKYVAKQLHLFSPFEGMYEYRLAQLIRECEFSDFENMTSCNYLTDQKRWCHKCPKCAWSFAVLAYAFGQEKAMQIVGANLFESPEIYKDILDPSVRKPFECVGERPEIWLVLKHCLEAGHKGKLLEEFRAQYLPRVTEFLPEFESKYGKTYENSALPEALRNAEPFKKTETVKEKARAAS